MDKGTLAFAIKANTFEVTPLGTDPMRMIPAAISDGNPKVVANVTATKGMMVKWLISPIITAFGIFKTPSKSFTLISVPMVNMINWINGTIKEENLKSPRWMKYCG
jgi:hypothetical protein